MYLYSYPSTHGISGLDEGGAWEQFEECLKLTIEWTQIYTPRPSSSDFGDALGGGNWAYLEILHLEALMSELRDALRDYKRASLEMHLEPVIKRVGRCTWRSWSRELGGHNGACLEIHSEVVIESVWTCTWRPWSSVLERCTWRP